MAKKRHPPKELGKGGQSETDANQRQHPPGWNYWENFPFPDYSGPPPGTYDPGLESQRLGSERGLQNLLEDLWREGMRARSDLKTQKGLKRRDFRRGQLDLRIDRRRGLGDLNRELGRGLQDIGFRRSDLVRNFTRDLGDLEQAKQRGEEDYNRTLAGLQRRYAALGARQTEQQTAGGTGEGGTTEAADAVRSANQAFDRAGVDTSHARSLEDIATRRGRLTEDESRALQRLGITEGRLRSDVGRGRSQLLADYLRSRGRNRQDFHTAIKLLQRGFHRGAQDRAEQRSRAILEQGIYEHDITSQQYFQAHQYDPTVQFPDPTSYDKPLPGGQGGPGVGNPGGHGNIPGPTVGGGGVGPPSARPVVSPVAPQTYRPLMRRRPIRNRLGPAPVVY